MDLFRIFVFCFFACVSFANASHRNGQVTIFTCKFTLNNIPSLFITNYILILHCANSHHTVSEYIQTLLLVQLCRLISSFRFVLKSQKQIYYTAQQLQ